MPLQDFEDNIRICRDSNDYYHSQSQYVSSSVVKTIAKQSVHHYLNQAPFNSPALMIGTAFHTLVLEPEEFEKDYLVANHKIDRRTKVGKAEAKSLEDKARDMGKDVLHYGDHNLIQTMAASVNANPEYVRLLDHCQKEVSFYIDDFTLPDFCMGDVVHFEPETKFKVRVRPDAYSKKPIRFAGKDLQNVVIDLKSCQDSSPRAFKNAVYQYGWHIQAAFYLDLLSHVSKHMELPAFETFYFMAVEKKNPYACQVYELSEKMLMDGRAQYCKALKMWHHYLETNEAMGFHSSDGLSELVITL
jgi:hypothetical protein